MKRIYTFDFIRGFAIFGVPVFHRIIWDYFYQNVGSVEGSSGIGFFLLTLIMSMAGIFYSISGLVNGYMSFKRLKEGKITVKQFLIKSVVAGVSLILIGLFFKYFMFRGIDNVASIKLATGVIQSENRTGVIPYLILYGKYPTNFKITVLFQLGAIQMIGYSIISVSIVLAFFYKRKGFDTPRKLRILLLLFGIIIFLCYPLIQHFLGPIAEETMENGKNFVSFFLNPFTQGLFPLFPYLAFGFFGAFFGVELAREDSEPKKVLKSMRRFWIITMSGGFVFLVVLVVTVGVDLESMLLWYYAIAREMFQLGIYFFLFWLGLKFFDYQPEEIRQRRMKWTRPIADFGRLTLTIFMFEGILAVSLQRLVMLFWPGWNATIANTALFGLINLATWILIVLIWKQFKFKGSIEHLSVVLVKAFSGLESQKIVFQPKQREI